MRRFWIILLAVAMGLVIALPAATAGKPDKPGKSPTLFDVHFQFEFLPDDDSDIFAGFDSTNTGCTAGGVITMEAGSANQLRSLDVESGYVPMLDVNFPGIESYRYYPYYPDAAAAIDDDFDPAGYPAVVPIEGQLVGCHGAGIEVVTQSWDDDQPPFTIDQRPGLLTLQVGNRTVDFAWNADYYVEMDAAQPRNPKEEQDPKVRMTDWEHFRFAGDALTWDGVWDKTMESSTGTGIVRGTISVLHPTRSGGFLDDYPEFAGIPVDVEVEFKMTIEEHG
jgi:hypothetical protein